MQIIKWKWHSLWIVNLFWTFRTFINWLKSENIFIHRKIDWLTTIASFRIDWMNVLSAFKWQSWMNTSLVHRVFSVIYLKPQVNLCESWWNYISYCRMNYVQRTTANSSVNVWKFNSEKWNVWFSIWVNALASCTKPKNDNSWKFHLILSIISKRNICSILLQSVAMNFRQLYTIYRWTCRCFHFHHYAVLCTHLLSIAEHFVSGKFAQMSITFT